MQQHMYLSSAYGRSDGAVLICTLKQHTCRLLPTRQALPFSAHIRRRIEYVSFVTEKYHRTATTSPISATASEQSPLSMTNDSRRKCHEHYIVKARLRRLYCIFFH